MIVTGPILDDAMLRFVRRRRLIRATAVMCLAIAITVFVLLAFAILDRLLGFSQTGRLISWIILVSIMVIALSRVAWLLISREYDPILAAKRIEQRVPELKDQLVTIVTQRLLPASQQASPELTSALAQTAARTLANYPPEGLITSKATRPAEIVLAAALILTIVLAFIPKLGLPTLVARILTPLADIEPVTTANIRVITGSVDVPQGAPLAIVADISNAESAVLLIGSEESALTPIAMPRVFAGRFAITLAAVERNLTYRIRAGDAESPAYAIRTFTTASPAKQPAAVSASTQPSGDAVPEGFERRVAVYHRLIRSHE